MSFDKLFDEINKLDLLLESDKTDCFLNVHLGDIENYFTEFAESINELQIKNPKFFIERNFFGFVQNIKEIKRFDKSINFVKQTKLNIFIESENLRIKRAKQYLKIYSIFYDIYCNLLNE